MNPVRVSPKGVLAWKGDLKIDSVLNADVTTAFPIDQAIGDLVAFNSYILMLVFPIRMAGMLVAQSSRGDDLSSTVRDLDDRGVSDFVAKMVSAR